MTTPELLPCPFCGGCAVALTGPVTTLWGVSCLRCACWLDDRAPTADQAIAAWNRRDPAVLAALPEVQALIRAAERNMMARHILALRNRQAVYRAKAEQHGKDAFAKGVSSEAHIAIWAEYEKVTHTAEAHDYMIAAIRGPKP